MTSFRLISLLLLSILPLKTFAVTIGQAWSTCNSEVVSNSYYTQSCYYHSTYNHIRRKQVTIGTGSMTDIEVYSFDAADKCTSTQVFSTITGSCYTPCNTNTVVDLVNPYTIHWQTQGSNEQCIDNSLTCNPPSTVNFELRQCDAPQPPQCIGQQTLNVLTNQCESPQCSSPLVLDPITQICKITCQGDDNPDYATNTCSPPICPSGYQYDPTTHACTAIPDPTCLPTQHLENHLCVDPTCFTPSVLNPTTHECEVPPPPDPTCASPSVLNPATNQCETPNPDPGTGGTGDPGTGGTGDPGTGGTGDPGTGGTGDPGTGGTGDPGTDPGPAQSYSNAHGDTSLFDLAAVDLEITNAKGEYSNKLNQIYNNSRTIMITSIPYDLPTIHMFDMNGTSVDIDLSTYSNFFDKLGYVFVFIATCMAIMILLE